MTKRPAITQKMQLEFAKRWALFPCVDCDTERHEGMPRALYRWSEIEKDHSHELADEGEHADDNLFPRCKHHHKTKTKRNEKLRHHLDRAGEKHRGEWEKKKGPPLKSRGFTGWRKFDGTIVRKS